MGKRGKSQRKGNGNPKRKRPDEDNAFDEDMDDEIDACKFSGSVFFL